MSTEVLLKQLDEPYEVSAEQIRKFREDGFIKVKNVFSKEILDEFRPVITGVVMEANPLKDTPMEKRTTYQQAFIQVTNIWEKNEKAKVFSFNKRTAQIAADLLGAEGIRMWHDQALYKEGGGGFTPWHCDQQYWPMATAKSVTAWIPFQAVPMEMGPLCFGKGSHVKNVGHDIEISDESEQLIRAAIKEHGIVEAQEPYDLGEVSFHTGWTLHRAGPNNTGRPREVHTIIYMDKDMRLAKPKNKNQQRDWEAWTPSTNIGEIMEDPLNPILYERM